MADGTLEAIQALVATGRPWVCQRYIERPLLLRGYKTHVRVYVLLVGQNEPSRSVYLYRPIHTRSPSPRPPLPPLRLCAKVMALVLLFCQRMPRFDHMMICRLNSVTGVSWSGIRVRVQLIGHL